MAFSISAEKRSGIYSIIRTRLFIAKELLFSYVCYLTEDLYVYIDVGFSSVRVKLFGAYERIDHGTVKVSGEQRGSITEYFSLKKNPRGFATSGDTCHVTAWIGEPTYRYLDAPIGMWSSAHHEYNAVLDLSDDVIAKINEALFSPGPSGMSVLQEHVKETLESIDSGFRNEFINAFIANDTAYQTLNYWALATEGGTVSKGTDSFRYLLDGGYGFSPEQVEAVRNEIAATGSAPYLDCHNALAESSDLPFYPNSDGRIEGNVRFSLTQTQSQPTATNNLPGQNNENWSYPGVYANHYWYTNVTELLGEIIEADDKVNGKLTPEVCEVLPGTTRCKEYGVDFPLYFYSDDGIRKQGLKYEKRSGEYELSSNSFSPRFSALVDNTKYGLWSYKVYLRHIGHRGLAEENEPDRFGEAWIGFFDPPTASAAPSVLTINKSYSQNPIWLALRQNEHGDNESDGLDELSSALVSPSETRRVHFLGLSMNSADLARVVGGEHSENPFEEILRRRLGLADDEFRSYARWSQLYGREAIVTLIYNPPLRRKLLSVRDSIGIEDVVVELENARELLFGHRQGAD